MTWKISSVTHTTTVLVDVTPARYVRNQAGVEYRVEWVEFVYEDGKLINTADGLGINVLGRRVWHGVIPPPQKPTRCFLLFANHEWLEGMRRTIDASYAITRTPHADTPVRGADVADPDTQAA